MTSIGTSSIRRGQFRPPPSGEVSEGKVWKIRRSLMSAVSGKVVILAEHRGQKVFCRIAAFYGVFISCIVSDAGGVSGKNR